MIEIYEILTSDNIVSSINNNLELLLTLIPELIPTIGFSHNHPHHHLDVWNHTLLALSLSENDFETRLVLLLHDIGKPHSYQDDEVRHFHNHAEVSSIIAKPILERLSLTEEKITELTYLIKEHDTEISKEEISTNKDLAIKKFKVQFCDALAHNPTKLKKRIAYLKEQLKLLSIPKDQGYQHKLVYFDR